MLRCAAQILAHLKYIYLHFMTRKTQQDVTNWIVAPLEGVAI